jgi:hypothetical protein
MYLYLPGIFLLLLAFFTVFKVFKKISPLVVAVGSLFAILYVGYSHYNTFKDEYKHMSMSNVIKALSPYIIVGALFFFVSSYLLYLLKRNKSPALPEGTPTPSPQSATNPLTYAVGNVMSVLNPNPAPAAPKQPNIRPATNRSAENKELNALLSAIKRV